MDSMKTKFYKRLVPIALIASMAITNVGITSASAEAIVNPPSIGEESGAPIVEAHGGVAFNENGYGDYGIADNAVVYAEYGTSDDSAEITVEVGGDVSELTEEDYALNTAYADTWADGTSVVSTASAINKSTKKVTFNIPLAKFQKSGENYSDIVAYIYIWKKGEGPSFKKTNDKTITIKYKKKASGSDPAPTVAAGDVFQIPGGLAAKTGSINGYVVGVGKVITNKANPESYEVINTEIKEGDDDNTVGTWEGAMNGASSAVADLRPAPTNALTGYVLYYNADKADGRATRQYIRMLNNTEATALPKEDYKKLTDLTAAQITESQATVVTLLGSAADSEVAKSISKAAASVGTNQTPDTGTEYIIENKKVDLAADKALGTDTKFVNALIDAYNAVEEHSETTAKIPVDNHDDYTGTVAGVTATKGDDGKYTYTITAAGAAALIGSTGANLDTYAKWKAIFDKSGDESKAFFTAVEAYAKTAKVNTLNAAIAASSDRDLNNIIWVMETTKASNEATKVNGKDVYPAASGAAKFWGRSYAQKKVKNELVDNIGTKDGAVAKTKGASVVVSNTKAAGKFNAAVYIKGVSRDYVPAKKGKEMAGSVYFAEGFYIPPALPTAFKDGAKLPTGMSANGKTAANIPVYKLELATGKSVKIPFALKDGTEKELAYSLCGDCEGFTVVNGKVTATDANDTTFATQAAGIVTVDDATDNTIKVFSRSKPEICAYVQVKTTAAFKSLRANATSIAVWPDSEQCISLGTVPASADSNLKYKITAPSGVTVEYMKWDVITAAHYEQPAVYGWVPTALEGGFAESNLLQVTCATGTVAKGSVIKAELYNGNTAVSGVKPLEIKVTPVTAPQDIKSVKTGVKSKETVVEGGVEFKVINVPKGGAVNLNYSVTPNSADATVDPHVSDEDVAVVGGDVVYGLEVGTTTMSIRPANYNTISDSFKNSKDTTETGTANYMINVYEPGGSITFPDTNYAIKGGFLMTAGAAASDCAREFTAGKTEYMLAPTAGTSEPIIWTANTPSAVKFVQDKATTANQSGKYDGKGFENNDEILEITPLQTGTFTITGTTKYTKQKIAFKMLVGASNENAASASGKYIDFVKADGTVVAAPVAAQGDEDAVPQTTVYVGEKINAFMGTATQNVGGPVKFELADAADKDKATVNAKGLITAKGAGTITVKATMTAGSTTIEETRTLEITAKPITLKSNEFDIGTVADDAKGAKVSVALNNYNKKSNDLIWTVQSGREDPVAIDALKNKLSGSITGLTAGKIYSVYVTPVAAGAENVTAAAAIASDDKILVGSITVYDAAIKAADTSKGDPATKKAVAALGGKFDKTKTPHNGVVTNKTYYIPIFAKDKDGNYIQAGSADDVTLNLSNRSLVDVDPANTSFITTVDKATLVAAEAENDIVKNYADAYGFIKVKTNNAGLSGIETIKATLKNSNKAVTVKLNVLSAAEIADYTVDTPYSPQDVTLDGTTLNTVTLSNIAAASKANETNPFVVNVSKGDGTSTQSPGYKTLQDIAKNKKLKASGKITTWQYVLVNSDNIKELKTVKLGENVVIPTDVEDLDGKGATGAKAVKFKATFSPVPNTVYLALAQVTYPMDVEYKAAVTSGDNQSAEQLAQLKTGAEDITVKVMSIASKTPMVKATAQSSYGTLGRFDSTITNLPNGNPVKLADKVGEDGQTANYKIVVGNLNVQNSYTDCQAYSRLTLSIDGDDVKIALTDPADNISEDVHIIHKTNGSGTWTEIASTHVNSGTNITP
jgi:hypothetical protein